MIIRSADDVTGTEHDVSGPGWRSRRILTAADKMGFSLNDVLIEPGFGLDLEYRHHLEACYVVSGQMEVTVTATGQEHAIGPGGVYAGDQHDAHTARSAGGARLVCIFNPALRGTERHVDGGYEPSEPSLED
jgi:L-ectoine synthase